MLSSRQGSDNGIEKLENQGERMAGGGGSHGNDTKHQQGAVEPASSL